LFVNENPYAERLVRSQTGRFEDDVGDFLYEPGLSFLVECSGRDRHIDEEARSLSSAVFTAPAGSSSRTAQD
jgi:hypothetical protein